MWLLLPLGLIGLLTAIGGLTDLLGSLRTPMAAALQGPASVGRQVAWAAAGLAVLAWVIGEALRARQPRAWRPFSRASWLLGQAVAVALLGDICVQTVERMGETLYEGLAPESALAVLRGGVPAVLLVGGLALVRTPLVAGWFGERSSPSARYRAAIARPWEGLAAALTTRTGRALSVALLLVAGAAVLTVTQGRPYVIWAGGHTSERMGNYRVAVDRFRYLAKSQHPRLAAPARTHESVARYHRTAARLQQHSARDETEAAVQDVLTLKEDVSGLVAAHKELPAALQPKVPDVVAGAAEAFLDWRRWALAHEMFVILLRDFPASQYTRELVERAEWRLAAIEGVSNPYSVPSVPLSIARRSWEGADWEADYESLEPGEGNRLVVVAAKLVHIGRSRKELVADRFAMKGDQAGSYRSHGFQFDEMNTVPTDAGNIPVRMQSLKPSREFKGISVGPDPCRVRMVFEVPAAAGDLDLYLDGKKIADL
ncbi:MAG: hypothetical protein FJX74_14005 [Armatimonadetes bacterium]|nr:hypothetical protein [Armatimonadota bacterium]